MPSYDFQCSKCEHEEIMYIMSSRVNEIFNCSECGEKASVRVWRKMPGTTRASYIDSAKTSRAAEMKNLKDIAQLEIQRAGTKPSERSDINKEIRDKKTNPK